MGQLLLIAAATFVSEDLTCIATGVLIATGKLGFLPGVVACILGIYAGDLLLYFAGRFAGRPIVRWRLVRNILTEKKLDQASKWLSDRGASVIFLSRFTPGLRLPTYVGAGLLKTRFWTFAAYFLLAAMVWTPLLVGAAALLGEGILRSAIARTPLLALLFVPPLLIRARRQTSAPPLDVRTRGRLIRRRLIGSVRRATRWEFWPPWLVYIPLIPYLLYLGWKHRGLTLFTAANPGIPSGGFAGEFKSRILASLTHVPSFKVIFAFLAVDARVQSANEFLRTHGLHYPVVLKPDVGERGTGVAIIRSGHELASYLRTTTVDTIIQKYVGGLEFGVFYFRYPGQPHGRIFSITEKRFPEVIGDGHRTTSELVLDDERAVCLAGVYMRGIRDSVPAWGERVRLVEIGSHCRGAIFLNGAHLETPELLRAIEEAARSVPGFYFGRFDLRSGSLADFQAGRFEILELNGVSAEATHIYDPCLTVLEAYRVMFRQWRIAFAIGARNRASGAEPMRFLDLVKLVRSRGAEMRQLTRRYPPIRGE